MELRPYQQECLNRVVEQFKQFRAFISEHTSAGIAESEELRQQFNRLQTALIVLPTGCGKTIVFCSVEIELRNLLRQAADEGLNTLIIAHRQELLKQARDKYQMLIPEMSIGLVGDGIHEYGAPITVASVQTISRANHLAQLKNFGYQFIVIDEAHHVAANGYQAVLDALPGAFRLFVTATPDRLDGKPIIEHEPIYDASIIDMVAQGYLCNLTPIAVRTDTTLAGISRSMGDYNERELEEIIDNPRRNQRIVEAYLEHAAGRQFLCFSVTVKHAENLAACFQANGVHVAVVSGKTPSELRARILKDFERGIIVGVVNCGVLTEGYDNPEVSCIILARPTQSRALFVQCIGRGTRLAPGKQDCIILDITDNCLKHSLEPMNLAKALGKKINDRESVLEMLDREEKERKQAKKDGDAQERRIRQKQREKDLVINLLQRFEWRKNDAGYYVLEVGAMKHRIALIPDKTNAGLWRVGAKLAPTYQFQMWRDIPMPLDWAQQFAESEAKKLLAGAAVKLVDRNASWRQLPATDEQIARLDKWHVGYPVDTTGKCLWTRGQASEAISAKIEQFKKQAAERDARKQAATA